MSEVSKDPKRESLKKHAELLKQELSAAITSKDLTSAAGILKKLQGMPSEFVPADLSSLAEQLKSEISSNSGPSPESAAEAARKAKEEEERKIMAAGERAFDNLKKAVDEAESYRTRVDVKESIEKTKLAAEKVKRGESLNDTEVRDSADHVSEHMPQILRGLKNMAEIPTKEELEEQARKRELLIRQFGPESKEVKDHDKRLSEQLRRKDNEIVQHVTIVRSGCTLLTDERAQKELRKRGIDPEAQRKASEEVLAMVGAYNSSDRGLEGRVDLGAQAKEVSTPKAKQGADPSQTTISVIPVSEAEKVVTSLTRNVVRVDVVTSPSPTPPSPRVFKSLNNNRPTR
jgi:hypothetical protein